MTLTLSCYLVMEMVHRGHIPRVLWASLGRNEMLLRSVFIHGHFIVFCHFVVFGGFPSGANGKESVC